jgi:ubiquitin conjugation factor E4 B
MSKIHALQLAYRTQLFDAELVFQSIGFINFVSTWLIRLVDPRRSHPAVEVSCVPSFCASSTLHFGFRLPLPNDVPMAFRTLPELIIEDIVDYLLFVARCDRFHCMTVVPTSCMMKVFTRELRPLWQE